MTRCSAFVVFCVGFFWLPLMARATTIASVSLDEMLERAELVFEGTVSSVEVRAGEDRFSIHTCTRFDIIEILKGPPVGDTIELCFAGGTKDGIRRKIEGMVYPGREETGIYFVKSLTQRYVNPFYGWKQGHFRAVRRQGSMAREVQVWDGRPVVSIDRTHPVPDDGLSTGVVRGVRVMEAWEIGQTPMTLEAFKAKLLEMLEDLR